MENISENQTTKSEQKFIDKYGIWIIVFGLITLVFILKYLLDLMQG